MKIAISVPDDLFERGEQVAERLGINRSQLYASALGDFLAALGPDPVTQRLDEIAATTASETAPPSSAAARRLIDAGAWEW